MVKTGGKWEKSGQIPLAGFPIVTVQVLFLALALTLEDCTDFTQLSRLPNPSQVSS